MCGASSKTIVFILCLIGIWGGTNPSAQGGLPVDTDPPMLLRAEYVDDLTVVVTVSEPLETDPLLSSSEDPFSYTLEEIGGGEVRFFATAEYIDGPVPQLHLELIDPRDPGKRYELRVFGGVVTDLSGNPIDYPNNVIVVEERSKTLYFDDAWKFNDTQTTDLPPSWVDSDYDDSSWAQGRGVLGVEENLVPPANGTLPPIMTPLRSTLEGGPNTIYLRRKFMASAAAEGKAFQYILRSIYDDGVVVYLNGTEVLRKGVAGGQTFASPAISHEANVIDEDILTGVVPGENTLAVELHQVNAASSDAVWGCELEAMEVLVPLNVVSVASVGGGYVGVRFDLPLDPVTAQNPANYVINNGAVKVDSVTLRPNQREVRLEMVDPVAGNFLLAVNSVLSVAGASIDDGRDSANGQVWANGRDVNGPAGSGPTSPPGSNFSAAVGEVEVTAGGSDIWSTSDEFHFVYQQRAGDFDIKVKVSRLDAANNWSKAGLMARETLDGNSVTIESYTTPSDPPGTATYENGRRPSTGADTLEWGTRPPTELPEAWIRLKRIGNTFRSWHGTDGENWSLMAGPVNQPMATSLLVGMATTSHNTAMTTTAQFEQFQDVVFPDAQIQIVQHPVSQTVDRNGDATFSVAATVTGAPTSELVYKWQRSTDRGVTFQTIFGANNPSYTVSRVGFANDGEAYRVIVEVPGVAVISPPPSSSPAFLNVIADVNPPRLVRATAGSNFDTITIVYNERVEEFSATDPFGYEVFNSSGDSLFVNGVRFGPDEFSVILELDELTPLELDTDYRVVVNDVLDLEFNEIDPDSEISFHSLVISPYFVRQEDYLGIFGLAVADLENAPAFPDHPSRSFFLKSISMPRNIADNYGARLTGFVRPSTSGDYTFHLRSDDASRLYFNPNGLESAGLMPILEETGCCGDFDRFTSAAFSLVAGQWYAFEFLVKEGGGGDFGDVAWKRTDDPTPLNDLQPIGGWNIGVAAESLGAGVTVLQQPMDLTIPCVESAPTLTEDFENGVPPDFLLFEHATVDPTGGVDDSGKLSLTPALNGQYGVAIMEDFSEGQPVEAFTAEFKVRFGDSTCCTEGTEIRPADGMSFNFATDIPDSRFIDSPISEAEEGGVGSGLRVTFDMWDSGEADEDGPGIGVWYNRALVASVSTAEPKPSGGPQTAIPIDPATGQPLRLYTGPDYANVRINLDPDGALDVFYKDIPVLQNVITGYTPISGGRFALGARTGGANETHFVDDLRITINPFASCLLDADFASNDGGFTQTTENGASPWTWSATSGAEGLGAWTVPGTAIGNANTHARLTSPVVTVMEGGPVTLRFHHRYSFESDWDGGAVFLSVNGGPFAQISNSDFTENPPNVTGLIGAHALNGGTGYNGDSPGYNNPAYLRSLAVGDFSAGDTLQVQFLAAFDQGAVGSYNPNWDIGRVQICELGEANQMVVFEVGAIGYTATDPDSPLAYQWERSRDHGANWELVPGAMSPTLTLEVDSSNLRNLYRAMIYTPGAMTVSSAASLNIVGCDVAPLLLSQFDFDDNGEDRLGFSPSMTLQNVTFLNSTLCLNGIYDTGAGGYRASARINDFSYEAFTVALDFFPLSLVGDFGSRRNIITGGPSYRWMSLLIVNGELGLALNNSQTPHVFSGAPVTVGQWHRLVCAVDLAEGKIRTFLNGVKLEEITLPPGFQFNVVGTAFEESDKVFSFVNPGNGQVFHGYADHLMVFRQGLYDEDVDTFFGGPILELIRLDSNEMLLKFPTELGRNYVVEYADELPAPAWIPFPPVLGNGRVARVIDQAPAASMRFYRVR